MAPALVVGCRDRWQCGRIGSRHGARLLVLAAVRLAREMLPSAWLSEACRSPQPFFVSPAWG